MAWWRIKRTAGQIGRLLDHGKLGLTSEHDAKHRITALEQYGEKLWIVVGLAPAAAGQVYDRRAVLPGRLEHVHRQRHVGVAAVNHVIRLRNGPGIRWSLGVGDLRAAEGH